MMTTEEVVHEVTIGWVRAPALTTPWVARLNHQPYASCSCGWQVVGVTSAGLALQVKQHTTPHPPHGDSGVSSGSDPACAEPSFFDDDEVA